MEHLSANHRLEVVRGDIRNINTTFKATQDIDAVIHLAAIVGAPACDLSQDDTIEINYLTTQTLTNACKYRGIERFLYASTCSVYGVSSHTVDESASTEPVLLYGMTKLKSETHILKEADDSFRPTILRMATIFGHSPGMRFDLVVNLLTAKAYLEGEISIFGEGNWRPFIHVRR